MKRFKRLYLCVILLGSAAATGSAQEWYVGATGGYAFAPSLTVKNATGSADTGLDNGYAVGAFFGDEMYDRWGGEARYLYRQSDLKVQSGGVSAHFGGNTNILTGDILWHARPRESAIRPFVAFGAGVRFLDGTGIESASQPLGRFAALTHTRETLAVGDFAVGIKANFRRSWQFRAEVHDYLSPAPGKVIAVAPGSSLSGWLNDIVGTASIAYRW